jgi:hypothetical protein
MQVYFLPEENSDVINWLIDTKHLEDVITEVENRIADCINLKLYLPCAYFTRRPSSHPLLSHPHTPIAIATSSCKQPFAAAVTVASSSIAVVIAS